MDRLYTAVRYDPEAKRNVEIKDLTAEFRRKDNASFLAKVTEDLIELKKGAEGEWFADSGAGCIGLIGEYGFIGAAIRQAQSLIRVERDPSLWSHSFLIHGGLTDDEKRNRHKSLSAWLWESTLEPATPFNHSVLRDGVGARHIGDYSFAGFNLF